MIGKQLTLFDGDADYYEDIEGQNNNSASFRVHASLVYKLGESLIADEITALSELIKNSYDADASACTVTIDSNYKEVIEDRECFGKIEISDNGCGMDLNTIINGWLTLSNSPKKKMKRELKTTPKYSRYPLGDKGLGRLSVQKLGRFMQLKTKTADSEIEYVVTIPWGDFLKNTTIDQIPVKVDKNTKSNNKSYTQIVIKDLVNSERWANEDQERFLANSISKIVSPFRSKEQTFRVITKINGRDIQIDTKAFEELLGTARAKYILKYRDGEASICARYKESFFRSIDNGLEKKVSFTGALFEDFLKVNNAKLPRVKRINEDGFVFEEYDERTFENIVSEADKEGNRKRYNDPGEFECEIYEFNRKGDYIEHIYDNYVDLNYESIIEQNEYKTFLDRYHGIKVVRDEFIIQGFGEGKGGDWLGLSTRQNTKGSFSDLKNENVIGCVYLTGIHNSSLKETTNREGFVNDGYYKNFKMILDDGILRINRNKSKLNKCMKEYLTNSLNMSSENIDGERGVGVALEAINRKANEISELISKNTEHIEKVGSKLELAKSIITSSPYVPKESISYFSEVEEGLKNINNELRKLLEQRDFISNETIKITYDFETLNEKLRDLFELAGLGLSVETFTHEFDTSIKNIKEKNQNIVKNSNNITIKDFVHHINYVNYSLDALRKQMSYFNPGLKFVRAERQIFNMREFLEDHKSFYRERCSRNNILFNLNIFTDFSVRMNKGMLNQVFDNLFNNSEYWLKFSKDYNYINQKEYFIEISEKGFVLVWDNGIGISRDIENRLFEPFESKKENGRGLGLYIVASNLHYNSANIRLLQERNKFGNLYKFEINLSDAAQ